MAHMHTASGDAFGSFLDDAPLAADGASDFFGGAWDYAPASAPPVLGTSDLVFAEDTVAAVSDVVDDSLLCAAPGGHMTMSPRELSNFQADLVLRSPGMHPLGAAGASPFALGNAGTYSNMTSPTLNVNQQHHQLRAALQLQMQQVPFIQRSVPFFGGAKPGGSPSLRGHSSVPGSPSAKNKDNLFMQLQRTQQHQTVLQAQNSMHGLFGGTSPLLMPNGRPNSNYAAAVAAAAYAQAMGETAPGSPFIETMMASPSLFATPACASGPASAGSSGSGASPTVDGPMSPNEPSFARSKRGRFSTMIGGECVQTSPQSALSSPGGNVMCSSPFQNAAALMSAAQMGFYPRMSATHNMHRPTKLPLKPMSRMSAPSTPTTTTNLVPQASLDKTMPLPVANIPKIVSLFLQARQQEHRKMHLGMDVGAGLRPAIKDKHILDERDRKSCVLFIEETGSVGNDTITVIELKTLLRRYEIQATGKKAELMDRMREYRRHVSLIVSHFDGGEKAHVNSRDCSVATNSASSSPETMNSEPEMTLRHAHEEPSSLLAKPPPCDTPDAADNLFNGDFGFDMTSCDASVFFST